MIEIKENEEVLAEEPFDFNTKIKKNIKLKAIYKGKIEYLTLHLTLKVVVLLNLLQSIKEFH